MSRILITSGPTRQFLDPVRFLTNASSGQMGRALAEEALQRDHEVTVVTGPVEIAYPERAETIHVVTTDEMLAACRERFSDCDGLIGAAAPCDYRPVKVATGKIAKTGEPLRLHLVETADVVATLGAERNDQWLVGFALETEDHRFRALTKLENKSCDLIVLNEPSAMNSSDNSVEIIDRQGQVAAQLTGSKEMVAREIFRVIHERLIIDGKQK